jgi:hypothetical protein
VQSQLIYKAYLRTMKVKGLRKILAAGGALQAAFQANIEAIRSMQASEGITVVDSEDDFETHTYTFGGLSEVIDGNARQVCGALQMPMVRLMGEGPGGLNATDEGALRIWYDGIGKEQEARYRRPIGRLFDVLYRSTLGEAPPEDFNFKFNPLWKVSKAEQAEIAGSVTQTVLSAHAAGVVSTQIALKELRQSSETTGVWTNIDDEAIDAAADMPPAPDMAPEGNPFGGPDKGEPEGKPGEAPQGQKITVKHPGGSVTVKPDTFQGKKDVTDDFDPTPRALVARRCRALVSVEFHAAGIRAQRRDQGVARAVRVAQDAGPAWRVEIDGNIVRLLQGEPPAALLDDVDPSPRGLRVVPSPRHAAQAPALPSPRNHPPQEAGLVLPARQRASHPKVTGTSAPRG